MKVDVNYEVIFDAIKKMESQETLTANENDAVLKVLKAVQGDYIPTQLEFDSQKNRLSILDNLDMDKEPTRFNRLLDECRVFENQYL
ncbi:hypothetical protein ABC382_01130 [Lysinibacillus sp. 1P01SD]|uniref:hypothetical protein n=1 Tax=Lysinibacillus sp. 1P01SD TaxID=3132285 RepID=UPI0039A06BC8